MKVTDDLYDEIQLFSTATFDYVVYVSHRIDKFGRCYVNGTTYSSDYNSTDRASVVKSMFVLSGTDEIHPYFGIIRFFFRIIIKRKDSAKQDLPPHMCLKTWSHVTWMTVADWAPIGERRAAWQGLGTRPGTLR